MLLAALVLVGCQLAPVEPSLAPAQGAQKAPNILIILADDLGWKDVEYNGSEIRTPNIDALAADGVILDRYYAQPTCSPTRAALMTGRMPMRLGVLKPIGKNNPTGLPLDEKILPQYLKEANYQTALTGKWHLGGRLRAYLPNARGFDHFYGNVTGGVGYWDHVHGGGLDWQRNGVTIREEGYATHLIADEAERVIRGRDLDRPLFLYVAFGAPHLPNEAPDETIADYSAIADPHRRKHAAMVAELDAAVGRIVGVLDAEGMLDNTVIWFMSDNGGLIAAPPPEIPPEQAVAQLEARLGVEVSPLFLEFQRINATEGGSDNAPLRGGKSTILEGGVRVPSFVYWRGRLAPRTEVQMITVQDVVPTLLSLARLPGRELHFDGQNVWDAIEAGEPLSPRDYVIQASKGGPTDEAIYRYPWKLIVSAGHDPQLYNVEADPREVNDLVDEEPVRVEVMLRTLNDIPRGSDIGDALAEAVRDPDFFGGPEDRPPWADTVR
jgi:arylsulfatase A-like enzyme